MGDGTGWNSAGPSRPAAENGETENVEYDVGHRPCDVGRMPSAELHRSERFVGLLGFLLLVVLLLLILLLIFFWMGLLERLLLLLRVELAPSLFPLVLLLLLLVRLHVLQRSHLAVLL